jgi:hypothetical protein
VVVLFAPLPVGSQSYDFYTGQHSIRIHAINFYDYDVSPDTFADHAITTFQDTADFIPTPIDNIAWHKVVAELDLPNKNVRYWVNDVTNLFTFDTIDNIPHSSLQSAAFPKPMKINISGCCTRPFLSVRCFKR